MIMGRPGSPPSPVSDVVIDDDVHDDLFDLTSEVPIQDQLRSPHLSADGDLEEDPEEVPLQERPSLRRSLSSSFQSPVPRSRGRLRRRPKSPVPVVRDSSPMPALNTDEESEVFTSSSDDSDDEPLSRKKRPVKLVPPRTFVPGFSVDSKHDDPDTSDSGDTDEEDAEADDEGEDEGEKEYKFTKTLPTKNLSVPPLKACGPRNVTKKSGETPEQCFWLCFPQEILTTLAAETNRYGDRLAQTPTKRGNDRSEWKPTDPTELRTFLSLIISMTVLRLPSLRLYWKSGTVGPITWPNFGRLMSRNRFEALFRCMHFSDNDLEPPYGSKDFDKLYKLGDVIEVLNRAWGHVWTLGTFVAIDEAMIGFQGRSYLVQYMPKKPVKWGFKLWVLACAHHGFCFMVMPYVGLRPGDSPSKDLGGSVVRGMCRDLDVGTVVVTDRFFSSPTLASDLLEQGLHLLSTIIPNRKFWPKELKLPSKAPRGSFDWLVCQSTGIRTLVWNDNSLVSMISTFGNPSTTYFCDRRGVKDKKTGKKKPVQVQIPTIIHLYNQYMGGVDLHDQIRGVYSVEDVVRTKFWYKKLFLGLLGISLTNAFLLWKNIRGPAVSSTHVEFMDRLIGSLSRRPVNSGPPSPNKVVLLFVITILTNHTHHTPTLPSQHTLSHVKF